jgi:hypothetical protein
MSDFKITDTVAGSQPIDEFSTVQNHPFGTIVRAKDAAATAYGEGEFIYMKGLASTAVGEWVTINMDDGTTALLAANAVGPVGLAMSANILATTYGWYQISGKGVGLVAAGFADNADCYATATAGTVDDAVVAGDRVHNANGASAIGTPATGQAEIQLNRPHTDNIAD